ncbi:LLM class flavin-dependent oxidoreductase [Lentibacillus cibarius]|uniref:LLM class flavin-dependent oxidoreductase n=1 Tax=Lentibacillus cibarius TaxID=2583219 RepID=A0A549YJQ0_9BACI|nr:LLM class flavin-dependent oxidoreductase [Lentibacillus cibarius]TMN23315.1 LLM class flavin-dependent oxidoreductase [Lentibacillus cibarius]TRM12099.1 LLM class flavin-dependent oxidoreductase [Lentibacillus cibarius]
MKLSVLDQAPISRGSGPVETLENTLELAKTAEKLGYTRYWVAEHHNTNGLTSVSPEILMARIASCTDTIRVGSGGVLLPQYSPYKVAENFKLLEAMFPGRIDLGIGRSPGGSQDTRLALTDGAPKSMQEFPRQLADLQGFLHNTLPKDHPYRLVKAAPRTETVPPMWVLGLSERGAANAAEQGAGFVFGHFISPAKGHEALRTYRENFQASPNAEKPHTIVCIFVVCADTEAEAEELALSQDKWLLNVGKGSDVKVPSIEEVKKRTFTKDELQEIKKNRERCVIGTPEQVKKTLHRLQDVYDTDEFMVITNIYDHKAKLHSYKLLAEAFQ